MSNDLPVYNLGLHMLRQNFGRRCAEFFPVAFSVVLVTSLEILPLTEATLAAALELDRRALGGFWNEEGYRREIGSTHSDFWVVRKRSGKQLLGLGCLWSILEEAHITVLAVDPAVQRQGIGQVLIYRLLWSAQRRGLEWATLEVRPSNQGAIALYEKFDFIRVGVRKKYYPDGEDALILWRKGLQQPEFAEAMAGYRAWVGDRLAVAGWRLNID
jgi:[ribosomal protein S18]-alanine N-acetyltransferase